jgi:hypothetical protein
MTILTTGTDEQFRRPEDIARKNLEHRVEGIRANTNLTPSAKASQIARAYQLTKAHVDGLAMAAAEDRVHAMKKATRAAFGTGDLAAKSTPAEVVAIEAVHRSAIDHVSAIMEPAALSSLLGQADDVGDEVLARAVGRQAHAVGADDVLAAFVAERPKQGEAVNALRAGKGDRMTDAITSRFFVPAPRELGNTPNDYTVQRLIDADPLASTQVGGH